MMSKCTENSNKEEYDSRDITMSKGGKNNEFILIEEKVELKKIFSTIRLTGPFCLFVLGSGDHSLGAGDQIPSQQTRQLKSLQISDTNKGMSAYSSVTNFASNLEIFKCIRQHVICFISVIFIYCFDNYRLTN